MGYGTMKYINGDSYDGHWILSKRHGNGVYKCTNGHSYDGMFQSNQRNGQGLYDNPDQVQSITGNWKKDAFIK